jgi:hypothetical protein
MNIAVMSKWIWRLFDPSEQDKLWFKLLQAKYVNVDNIFASSTQGDSQFWHSINKIKHFFKLGARSSVGGGRRTLFWTDCWLVEAPLAIRFPRLFDSCASKDILVADAMPVSATLLQFCRSFGPVELELWAALVQETSSVDLSNISDSVCWTLEPNGRFSVSSLYRKINQVLSLPHENFYGMLSSLSKSRSSFGRWPKEGYLLMLRLTGGTGHPMAVVRYVGSSNQ